MEWADLARGIAILLVLLGHTCPPPYTTAFIYAFHMPLFFVLSGLFLRVDEPLGQLLRKKTRTLLVPFVIYNLVLLFADWCLVALSPNKHDPVDIISRLLGTLTGWHGGLWNSSLWFLPCLFVAQLLVVGTYHLSRLTSRLLCCNIVAAPTPSSSSSSSPSPSSLAVFFWVLLSLAGVAYCHWVGYSLPMSLDSALIATGFLLMGRQVMKLNLKREAWWYWAITAIIFVSTTLDNYYTLGAGNNHVDLSTDTLGRPLNFYLAACGGSLLLIRGCQLIGESSKFSQTSAGFGTSENSRLLTSLLWLGRNSLIIYCLHRIPMNMGIGIWNATAHRLLPASFLATEPAATALRSFLLLLFTLLLLIPAVYIVNRWLPWTLGKARKSVNS